MPKNINRNYSIDFITNTISLSKSFEQAARQYGSNENRQLMELCCAFPKMKVSYKITKPRKAPKTARITYKNMQKFMACVPNAAHWLAEFETVKEGHCAPGNGQNK